MLYVDRVDELQLAIAGLLKDMIVKDKGFAPTGLLHARVARVQHASVF